MSIQDVITFVTVPAAMTKSIANSATTTNSNVLRTKSASPTSGIAMGLMIAKTAVTRRAVTSTARKMNAQFYTWMRKITDRRVLSKITTIRTVIE